MLPTDTADGAGQVFPVSVMVNVVVPVFSGVKIDVTPTVEMGVLATCFI